LSQSKCGALSLAAVTLIGTTACHHNGHHIVSPVDAINAMCPETGDQHFAECGSFCRTLIKDVGVVNHVTVGGGLAAVNFGENISSQQVSDALLLSVSRSTIACNAYYHEPPKISEQEFVQILIGTDGGPAPLPAIKLLEPNVSPDTALAKELESAGFVFLNELVSQLSKLTDKGREQILSAFKNDRPGDVSGWLNSIRDALRLQPEPPTADLLKSIDQKISSLESTLNTLAAKVLPGDANRGQQEPTTPATLSPDELRRTIETRLDAAKAELDRLAATISSYKSAGSPGATSIDEELKALDGRITSLKSDVKTLADAFASQGTFVRELEIQIYFAQGRSFLSPDALLSLEKLRKYSGPQWFFRVIGFADRTGTPELNLRLGRDRANAVAAWIVSQLDISPDRTVAISGGETDRFPANNRLNGNRTAIVYVVRRSGV